MDKNKTMNNEEYPDLRFPDIRDAKIDQLLSLVSKQSQTIESMQSSIKWMQSKLLSIEKTVDYIKRWH